MKIDIRSITKGGIVLLSALLCSVVIAYFCQEKADPNVTVQAVQNIPTDWFFRQRAYPAGRIDRDALLKALRAKKQLEKERQVHRNLHRPWIFAGPTNIGGRVTDIELHPENGSTVYLGTASGGIFRSVDGGNRWMPIFDEALSLSIGDLAVSSSDPQLLYAGTGEANAGGGSLAYDGVGIYRSDDGGASWIHRGLDQVGSIGKVIIAPDDPDRVYVAAMGRLFGNNRERGVFRTKDGGNSWEQVLFVSDSTGAIDLAIHPRHPDTLYTALWERIRRPHRRQYGGITSGIYRSVDGGNTWQQLRGGLPEAGFQKGRIGIAIAPSEPNIVYAVYTDAIGFLQGVYRTRDHGAHWTSINIEGIRSVSYMWWFGKIYVDPTNSEVLYVLALDVFKSGNGGINWQPVFPGVHVDQHAIAFDPVYPGRVYTGNDGGLYRSDNGGLSSIKISDLPITQFYTATIDFLEPHRLYGGTQDNGSVRTLTGGEDDWEIIYFGDGFYNLIDPTDNRFVYTESQFGGLARSEDGGTTFETARNGIASTDRKNWKTPVVFDPKDPRILYYGTNRLYRSTDRARSWQAVSPDLTNGKIPGNLVFGTITSISVSPVNSHIIYIGTDDGNVALTRNGGQNWVSVSSALPKRWVTAVACDPHDDQAAYVTLSGYRFDSNLSHVFYTADNGRNWEDIGSDLPDVPVNDIIVDPSLGHLYLATDIGVYYSENNGDRWEVLGTDLPNVVISDLCYHPPTRTLVAATYGRSLYKYNLEETTGLEKVREEPDQYVQLYPNPATAGVTLELELTNSSDVRLELFDLQGRSVLQLLQPGLFQGKHQIELDIRQLTAGVYFCQVSLKDRTFTVKMLVR